LADKTSLKLKLEFKDLFEYQLSVVSQCNAALTCLMPNILTIQGIVLPKKN